MARSSAHRLGKALDCYFLDLSVFFELLGDFLSFLVFAFFASFDVVFLLDAFALFFADFALDDFLASVFVDLLLVDFFAVVVDFALSFLRVVFFASVALPLALRLVAVLAEAALVFGFVVLGAEVMPRDVDALPFIPVTVLSPMPGTLARSPSDLNGPFLRR